MTYRRKLILDQPPAPRPASLHATISEAPSAAERADAILTPLREYEAGTGMPLLTSLRVFLATDCSWTAAGRVLHCHDNTLRYRIRRVHQITGLDPTRVEDLVDLYLALTIHDQPGTPSTGTE